MTTSKHCLRELADMVNHSMRTIIIAPSIVDKLSRRDVYDDLPVPVMELQVNIEIALANNDIKLYRTLPFPTASSLSLHP